MYIPRLDRYNSEKAFFPELSMPICANHQPSAGYEYQKFDVNSPTPGGLPRWNTDGSKIAMTARVVPPRTVYNNKEINKFFVTRFKQRFAESWQATLNATHTEVKFDSKNDVYRRVSRQRQVRW